MNCQNRCIIIADNVAGAPLLIVYKENEKKLRHVIFLFHRLLTNKENELQIAYHLANDGYFVVLIDMCGHGQREESFDKTDHYDFNSLFYDMNKTACEVEKIYEYIKNKHTKFEYVKAITSVGVSIGASVALLSSAVFPRINRVVSLIGCYDNNASLQRYDIFRFFLPDRKSISKKNICADIEKNNDLYRNIENYRPRIMFLNGKLDMTIPFEQAKKNFEELYEIYDRYQEGKKLCIKFYERTGHYVTAKMINDLRKWLELTDGVE